MAAQAAEGAAATAVRSVLNRVRQAAEQAGRRAEDVRVVAVGKTKPTSLIREVYDSGHRDFGENYVQEIIEKAPQLPEDIRWRFIGHLQSNKVKPLLAGVPNLAAVEGVDSLKLAKNLDREVYRLGRPPLNVFVQVNTSGEVSKSGVEPSECVELAKLVKVDCPNLQFSGLMTIGMADYSSTPENFKTLLNCRTEVCKALGVPESQCELSMGMSNDFEQAIKMGSTNSISGGQSLAEVLLGKAVISSSITEELLRGCSLHKIIRLITFTIGGSAYLNFMGNEFGHPKRVEFPMPSNNFSFALANRQWDLLSKEGVHSQLFLFDKDMMNLDRTDRILSRGSGGCSNIHHINDSTMVIAYLRGPFLFIFNFHPENSYQSYRVGVDEAGEYQIILNTDEEKYGGQGSIERGRYVQRTISGRVDGMRTFLEVSLPSRTAQVYKLTRILRV